MDATSLYPGITGGNREDLGDKISLLEPEDTPFYSALKKGTKATAVFHEVLSMRLNSPRKGGTPEGSQMPAGGNKARTRARFGSYPNRFSNSFGVSDVQEAISRAGGTAGVPDEYEWDKMIALREAKRDIECTLLCRQETQKPADGVDMQLRGAFQWLENPGASAPAIPALFQTPAAQALTGVSAMLETGSNSLTSMLQSIVAQYGTKVRRFMCYCGTSYQLSLDSLTRTDNQGGVSSARFRVNQDNDDEITLAVKSFHSSFGILDFIVDLFIDIDGNGVGNPSCMLVANMELWELWELEAFHTVDNPPSAAGLTGYWKYIVGLGCNNPRGNAFMVNSFNA